MFYYYEITKQKHSRTISLYAARRQNGKSRFEPQRNMHVKKTNISKKGRQGVKTIVPEDQEHRQLKTPVKDRLKAELAKRSAKAYAEKLRV